MLLYYLFTLVPIFQAWPNIKPVLVKALTVSQHHSVLSITSSSLPIYISLAKAVLSCYVDQLKINPNLPVPSDTSEFPQYIQALFSVSSNNKRCIYCKILRLHVLYF